MERHSSLFMTIEYSVIINILKKLGLVMTSSTKIEVVSNNKMFTKCIWFKFFHLA